MARGDLYERLGVRHDATPEAIHRAYLRLAKKLHPDLNRTAGTNERFLAVKEAYEILSSPLLRREYDDRSMSSPIWETPPPIQRPGRTIRVTVPYATR